MHRIPTVFLQILCAALNGVALPSFPKHSVAVKYAPRDPLLATSLSHADAVSDMQLSIAVAFA
jgi:hypothetical protein